MGNVAAAAAAAVTGSGEEERRSSWLKEYLEGLGGQDAYREFQERYYGTPEYYELVASLAA